MRKFNFALFLLVMFLATGLSCSLLEPMLLTSLSFSADGKLLAGTLSDNTVRIWDAHTGKPFKTLSGHTGLVESSAFSPDGHLLATGAMDATARIWDTSNWSQIRVFTHRVEPGGFPHIGTVAFSPDGRLFLTASLFQGVQIWNTKTWELVQTLEPAGAWEAHFSSTGDRLAVLTKSGVNIYDTVTFEPSFNAPNEKVKAMGLSPDGTMLVTGSSNYDERGRMLIETWEIPSGRRLSSGGIPFTSPPHFAFSPDGSILVVGDGSGAVRFWDFRTGKQTSLLYQFNDPNNIAGTFSYIISALTFSPDGSLLAAGVDKFTFAVWAVSSRQLIWKFSD